MTEAGRAPLDTTGRYERERTFHNELYRQGLRPESSFYVINDRCEQRYDDLVTAVAPGDDVLEYGCGAGSKSFALAERGAHVTGIDLSETAIEVARAEAARRDLPVTFVPMNAEHLEFDDHSFDLICGSAILHHLDLDRAGDEIRRTLRPGGRAVFLEPLGFNPLINLYRRLTPKHRTPDEHPFVERDFVTLGRYFGDVRVEVFVLVALLALPLRGRRSFDGLLRRLNAVDAWLVRRFRWIRRFAWTFVVELRDPRPQRSEVSSWRSF
jgi:SAM-dependent methyltransferase